MHWLSLHRPVAAAWLVGMALIATAQESDKAIQEQPSFELEDPLRVDPNEAPPPPALGSGNDCFLRGSVSDFDVLDRRNLIVFAPSKKPYLVEVSGTCIGLRFAETIGFQSRDNRICSYGGDDILVERSRCPILNIYKLDEVSYELTKARFASPSKD